MRQEGTARLGEKARAQAGNKNRQSERGKHKKQKTKKERQKERETTRQYGKSARVADRASSTPEKHRVSLRTQTQLYA